MEVDYTSLLSPVEHVESAALPTDQTIRAVQLLLACLGGEDGGHRTGGGDACGASPLATGDGERTDPSSSPRKR